MANAVVARMFPDSAVKGGRAIKMRFGDAATRFSSDLDAARRSDIEGHVARLESSLRVGWEGFTGPSSRGARPIRKECRTTVS